MKGHSCVDCKDNKRLSNGWARLRIPLDDKTEEQRENISKAIRLLRSNGVRFDYGIGGGILDLELDWSLIGAFVKVKPLKCMNCRKIVERETAVWKKMLRINDGWSPDYPHCSETCAKDKLIEMNIHKDNQWKWL